MKVSPKKLSDTQIEITVTLDADDLKTAREKTIARLSKEVKLEGFRKGKAPKELVEKALDPNKINSATIDLAVRTTVISAFSEVEKSPLVIPTVNVTKYVPDESAEYTATAEILPEIKLGNYKNLKVKKDENKVSKKDIDEIVANIQKAYSEKKVEKKPAELGDEVIIDFTGKKDDKPFRGGTAKDYALTLGSHSFISGFEEGIVGKTSGDKFDLNLTFPKDYPEKSLAGEKVMFEVLVKQVNAVILPELDDDFAKKCGPFKTMSELRDDIEKNLHTQNEHRLTEKFKDDLVEALVKASTVSAPEILISDQIRAIRLDAENNAKSAGQSFADYLKVMNLTEKEFESQAHELGEKRVKASLVLREVSAKEGITVSDDEVAAQIAQLREVYKKSAEALKNLKENRVKLEIANRMVIDKTLNFLVEVNSKSAK